MLTLHANHRTLQIHEKSEKMFRRSHLDDASQDHLVLHLWPLVRQHVIVSVSHAAIALTYVQKATEQKGVSYTPSEHGPET